MERPLKYRSFLLTAWQEHRQEYRQDADSDSLWRFGLEDARDDSRRQVFATLEEVMRYVEKMLEEALEGVPENAPENTSGDVPEDAPEDVSTEYMQSVKLDVIIQPSELVEEVISLDMFSRQQGGE